MDPSPSSAAFRGAPAVLCECTTCFCSAAVRTICDMCKHPICETCAVGHPVLLSHPMVVDHLGTIQLCNCRMPCGAPTCCHTCSDWLFTTQLKYPGLCLDDPWAYVACMKAEILQRKIWWCNIMDEVNGTR